jgi:Ulp1 family protease
MLYSLTGRVFGNKCLAIGLRWVRDFISFYRGHEINVDDWTKECCFTNTPSQIGNGTECGVILLASAEYLSEDKCLNFTLEDMPSYRKYLILQILSHS